MSENKTVVSVVEEKTIEETTQKEQNTPPKAFKPYAKIFFAIIFAIVTIFAVWFISNSAKSKNTTTISKSSLEKIIEINELSTVDYTYNATIRKTKKDSDDVMYYVAYEGIVTAGIDFKKITFDLDEKKKTITITIPDVEIQNVSVDMGTMEYIFTKDKYETETISQEAYKLCKDDLRKRATKEILLKETAKENAISSVEALFKPWIEPVDNEYKVIVK